MILKKEILSAEELNRGSLTNCITDGKTIKSRKGFFTQKEDFIFKIDGSEAFEMSFFTTDCFLFLDGKYGQIAISVADNLMGSISYNIMLICTDRTNISLGRINFTTSGSAAGFPDSFAVFSGKANQGAGIYFISRKVYDGEEDMVSVRELSADRKNWILLTEEYIYTPTVLANGRGEAYHTAEINGRGLSLAAPLLFESKNMLSSKFKAAYTTDGASSGFSLPYTKIDNASVFADLFYKEKKYVFEISGSAVKSSAVTVDSAEVVMNVDRTEGRVYFTLKSGGKWIPDFMGSLNNLCITASKTVADHKKIIGGASASRVAQGEVSLLYKNSAVPSAIVVNSPTNPLYFPENTAGLIGSAESMVDYVTAAAGKLLAFKSGEIYSAALGGYSTNKKTAEILGEIKQTEEYFLSFKNTASFSGRAIAATIREIGSKILFQTVSGDIFETKASGSAQLQKIAQTADVFDFAVTDKGRYILIRGEKAAVLEKTDNGWHTGEWILPCSAVGGFSYLGDAVFFFRYTSGSLYMIYAANYGSDSDETFISEHETALRKVEAAICTRIADGQTGYKKMIKASVAGDAKDPTISLLNGEKELVCRRGRFKDGFADFKVGHIVRDPYIKLSFSSPAHINEITCEYRI